MLLRSSAEGGVDAVKGAESNVPLVIATPFLKVFFVADVAVNHCEVIDS
jgi:hypothetical protein